MLHDISMKNMSFTKCWGQMRDALCSPPVSIQRPFFPGTAANLNAPEVFIQDDP